MIENKKKENIFKQMFVTRTQGFIDISKKRDFWKNFADEYGGTFQVKQTVSKDLEILNLEIPYKQYSVEFTESDAHPLKINCKLNANDKFEFFIGKEDTIEKLLKFFNNKDIQTGDEEFDKKYSIQGKSPDVIKKIFTNKKIRMILSANNIFSYNCIYDKKNEILQLSCLVSRTINSKSELSELFELFRLTINEMENSDILKKDAIN
jgi:hypothetical protein